MPGESFFYPPASHRTGRRVAAAFAIGAMMVAICATGAAGAVSGQAGAGSIAMRAGGAVVAREGLTSHRWVWPVQPFRMERPFEATPHRYGAGHRGIDLRALDSTTTHAPADGVVAFAGMVAGRGILTIDHGAGLVTTLEPVVTTLEPGTPVTAGDVVGTLALGGHTSPGGLHFGVRLHGEYINPLLLLGGVPRAVLLPCC